MPDSWRLRSPQPEPGSSSTVPSPALSPAEGGISTPQSKAYPPGTDTTHRGRWDLTASCCCTVVFFYAEWMTLSNCGYKPAPHAIGETAVFFQFLVSARLPALQKEDLAEHRNCMPHRPSLRHLPAPSPPPHTSKPRCAYPLNPEMQWRP